MRVHARLLLICLLVVGVHATPGVAQVQTGEIFGKVVDSTGAVIPGVAVTIASPALLQPQDAVTTATGAYRFPQIPIGTYRVTFELTGFKRLVREGVVINTAFNAEINAVLEVSTVEETVTVSGESPIVDTKSTNIQANFTQEMLQTLPTARDPWVILEQTPGMVMDRQNVGGNQSGQQSGFLAHGSSANQMWNFDGASVTDMAANSSPGYYNFDSFEEIQVQTGGSDASIEAGGVSINLITKSGSNQVRGAARFNVTDESLQADNITDELRAQGAGSGNPIQNIIEYGGDVGGPIRKDKMWFWGALSRNDIKVGVVGFYTPGCTDPYNKACLQTDLTNLWNIDTKLNYQWSHGQKSTFYWGKGVKYRNARGASATVPLESTYRQTTPSIGNWQLSHQWIASDRLMFDAKYTYFDNNFTLDFHEDGLADVQATYDVATTMWGRSGDRVEYLRPTLEAKVDGNYFLSGVLNGDHALKFGFRYKSTPYQTLSTQGGGAIARFNNGVAYQARIIRDGHTSRDLWEYSAYLNDSYRLNRLTFNLGVRWDFQDDEALKAEVKPNPILPDLLPAISFSGADSGATYNNVSPRVGMTWDVLGDGRTVAKANFARYWGIGIYTAGTVSPTGSTSLTYWWNDLNRDTFIQRSEIDFARGFATTPSSNYDPANPSSVTTPARIDPNLKNDITDELIVGLDRELVANFGVSLSYIRRKYHQFQSTFRVYPDNSPVRSSDYAPVAYTGRCGNTSCDQPSYDVVYYQRATALPTNTLLRNHGQYRQYQGLEFVARKRMSDRWMVFFAYTWNDTRYYYPEPTEDYTDPTNIDQQQGAQIGTLNARWVGKLSGIYVLPYGFTTSAFFNFRDGFPFNRTVLSPSRTGAGGQVDVYVREYGAERHPNFYQLDWRLDKAFDLRMAKMLLVGSVFNVFNANTVLGRVTSQTSSRANNVTTVLAPRVARFDVRVTF